MMRLKIFIILIAFLASSVAAALTSCKKAGSEDIGFYNAEFRIGMWISPDKKDTLEFIGKSNLIRKGRPYIHEKYLYRINGKILYIRLPSSSHETQHPISNARGSSVVLGNMYISTGFGDNSGTFTKDAGD